MYTLKTSIRAKYLRITIHPGGEVIVTVPRLMKTEQVDLFLQKKRNWIEKKVRLMEKYPKKNNTVLSKKEISILKQKALLFIQERLEYYNTFYNYRWNKISVRSQKTRWGSCSQKGNLNFNYKIALLPEDLANYIIVHELCHLKAFNHSRFFWDLVAKTIPDHRKKRQELRRVGVALR